jgi:hypothetical protein
MLSGDTYSYKPRSQRGKARNAFMDCRWLFRGVAPERCASADRRQETSCTEKERDRRIGHRLGNEAVRGSGPVGIERSDQKERT